VLILSINERVKLKIKLRYEKTKVIILYFYYIFNIYLFVNYNQQSYNITKQNWLLKDTKKLTTLIILIN